MSAAQEWMAPADSSVRTGARPFDVIPGAGDAPAIPRIVRAVATLAAACLLTAVVLIVCAAVVSRWG